VVLVVIVVLVVLDRLVDGGRVNRANVGGLQKRLTLPIF
jgi:hypothetical protein